MKNYVWMCPALELNESYVSKFLSDIADKWIKDGEQMTPEERHARGREARGRLNRDERNGDGEILSADLFPKEAYYNYKDFRSRDLKNGMYGNTGPIVSKPVMEVMRRFDLGQCQFFPITMYKNDRTTKVAEYYGINYGNRKDVLLPEHSKNISLDSGFMELRTFIEGHAHDTYNIRWANRDDLAVSAAALDGPDIWVDGAVNGYLRAPFISDPLAQALRAEGLTRTFPLKRARVLAY